MSKPARGPRAAPVRRGLEAALVWLVVEISVRRVGVDAVLFGFKQFTRIQAPEFLRTSALVAAGTLAMVVLVPMFRRWAQREGLTASTLGYQFSGGAVLAGGLSAIVLFAVFLGTSIVDSTVFGPATELKWPERLAAAGPTVMLALLLGNGLLSPAVEEYAWRGYIQLRFIQGWGAVGGIIVTAFLFAAKHIIVDLSLIRTTTLIAGAVALGLIAHRWGTLASTVAHMVTNFAATLLVIAQAGGP